MLSSILRPLTLAVLLFVSPGCVSYQAPVMPPAALMFASVSAPLDHDAQETPISPLRGEATSRAFMWMFAFGDCSVDTAARMANMSRVHHVDYRYLNVLFGMYQAFTTVVYGE